MWASLYVDQTGEKVAWLVDTWSEQGVMPHLKPKLHWVSHEDGKFYHVLLNIDYQNSLKISEEDTEIEPHRAAFIRSTLATWEQEYGEGTLES
jgi:hypothetical protein